MLALDATVIAALEMIGRNFASSNSTWLDGRWSRLMIIAADHN
jgi:hypothetical protein